MNRCLCLRFDDNARNRWIRRPDTFRDSNSLARNKPSFVSKIWNDTRAISTPFFPFFFLFFIFHPLLRPPFHFVTNNPSLTNGIKTAQSPSPRSIGREKSIRLDFCLLQLNFVFLSRLCSLSLSLFFSGYCFPGARLFSRHFAPPHPPLSRINREKSGCGSRPNNSKIWIECREGMGLSNASKRGLSMKRRVAGTGG